MTHVGKARKLQVAKPGNPSRWRRAGPRAHLCDQLGRGLPLVLRPCREKKTPQDCATPTRPLCSAYGACEYCVQYGVGYGRSCVGGLAARRSELTAYSCRPPPGVRAAGTL
jgi:hypothetical protein